MFKALSDPTRLQLVALLGSRTPEKCGHDPCGCGSLCVNALARKLGVTQSAVSQHLRVLKHAGLVRGERRGAFVHYSLDERGIAACVASLCEVLNVTLPSK
ncbi:MAG: helix-turn-helix transcriptional regulator [Deltaproteobacteria bacterium]|nr:helix-turn-helix transcriptional regulator [Deltaproteobacteria bacterium]